MFRVLYNFYLIGFSELWEVGATMIPHFIAEAMEAYKG